MSPQTLLTRWRERWDKPAAETARMPYVYGKAKLWSDRFAHARAWSIPALCAALTVLGLLLMVVLLTVPVSLHGQIVSSAALFGVALFVRRYGGLLATLLLLWLSLCVTGRYLLWRFGESLGSLSGVDYVAALVLCVAELYLAIKLAGAIAQALWPATRPVTPLTGNPSQWPEVDIVIACAGQPAEAVAAAARAALAFDWPPRKRTLHLLDASARTDIDALAAELGIAYLVHPGGSGTDAVNINPVLAHARAELVLVLDCTAPAPASLLAATAGAFVHSPALAMLVSPMHFLAPAPPVSAKAQFAPEQTSFALLRRGALDLAGGLEEQLASWQPSTARTLQALGFACCYAGAPAAPEGATPDGAPGLVRLGLFSPWTLRCQVALARLDTLLRFYDVAPRCVLWGAPLLALLTDTVLIDAPVELLAAFLLPHLAHGYIARARMHARSRLGLVTEVRELLLACYLLLPTALTVLRTLLARAWRRPPGKPAPFAPAWQGLHTCLVLLHVAALVAGACAVPDAGAANRAMIVLSMLWCGYHLLLLGAMLAVSEEARQIGLHLRQQAARPAMLSLPLGRTLHCSTVNFPDTQLVLSLPVATVFKPGSRVDVALFEGDDEANFAARVIDQDGCLLRVGVDPELHAPYRQFSARALARGPNWPAWLAGRLADRPVPTWITAPFVAAMIAVLDFATHGRYLQWLGTRHWITLWKKKNEQAN